MKNEKHEICKSKNFENWHVTSQISDYGNSIIIV